MPNLVSAKDSPTKPDTAIAVVKTYRGLHHQKSNGKENPPIATDPLNSQSTLLIFLKAEAKNRRRLLKEHAVSTPWENTESFTQNAQSSIEPTYHPCIRSVKMSQ